MVGLDHELFPKSAESLAQKTSNYEGNIIDERTSYPCTRITVRVYEYKYTHRPVRNSVVEK